jgi:transposase
MKCSKGGQVLLVAPRNRVRARPRDLAGQTRRRIAGEELADLVVDKKLKALKAELNTAVAARRSRLMAIRGIGPVGAARILADVGDVARFADRNRSPPGPGPHRWRPPRVSTSGTGSPEPGTGG